MSGPFSFQRLNPCPPHRHGAKTRRMVARSCAFRAQRGDARIQAPPLGRVPAYPSLVPSGHDAHRCHRSNGFMENRPPSLPEKAIREDGTKASTNFRVSSGATGSGRHRYKTWGMDEFRSCLNAAAFETTTPCSNGSLVFEVGRRTSIHVDIETPLRRDSFGHIKSTRSLR